MALCVQTTWFGLARSARLEPIPGRRYPPRYMPTRYGYLTVDVFTERAFSGNPVAVMLDAKGLSTDEMHRVAAEFNYSESTFVLPPYDPSHNARVRINAQGRD